MEAVVEKDPNSYRALGANLRALDLATIREMKIEAYETRFNIRLSDKGRHNFSRSRTDAIRAKGGVKKKVETVVTERVAFKANDTLFTYEPPKDMDATRIKAVKIAIPMIVEGVIRKLGYEPRPFPSLKVVEVKEEDDVVRLEVRVKE